MKICSSCTLLAGAILSLSGFATSIEASDYSSFYKNLPIELSPVTPPSIPSLRLAESTTVSLSTPKLLQKLWRILQTKAADVL